MTGGQSAFTALPLPVSVFPTNAAGGLLVSRMQDERNGLMMSAVIQPVPCREIFFLLVVVSVAYLMHNVI